MTRFEYWVTIDSIMGRNIAAKKWLKYIICNEKLTFLFYGENGWISHRGCVLMGRMLVVSNHTDSREGFLRDVFFIWLCMTYFLFQSKMALALKINGFEKKIWKYICASLRYLLLCGWSVIDICVVLLVLSLTTRDISIENHTHDT